MNQQKPLSELLEFSIINIDKPSGPTSFDISDFVRKKLEKLCVRKTSHFGTLDPKVTGVLPIALNRACKLTGFFLGEDKEYVGIMRLHEEKSIKEVQEIINKKFLGKIKQTPPVKSRVKRQEREREIKKFEILERDTKNFSDKNFGATKSEKDKDFVGEGGKDFLFIAEVQGGTYIRKLIDDLGKELEIGAHMLELRRIRAGIFTECDKEYPSINLYDFEKAVEEAEKGNEELLRKILIPAETALKKIFPFAEVKDSSVKQLLTGKPVYYDDLKNKINMDGEQISCIFNNNHFIGIYKVINDKKSGIFARAEFVMQPVNNIS